MAHHIDPPPSGSDVTPDSLPDPLRGLEAKYSVSKIHDPEGKHDDCPYFVLDLRHDQIARQAGREYARIIATAYPQLALELNRLILQEELKAFEGETQ